MEKGRRGRAGSCVGTRRMDAGIIVTRLTTMNAE
jgi:hypothetical protein